MITVAPPLSACLIIIVLSSFNVFKAFDQSVPLSHVDSRMLLGIGLSTDHSVVVVRSSIYLSQVRYLALVHAHRSVQIVGFFFQILVSLVSVISCLNH